MRKLPSNLCSRQSFLKCGSCSDSLRQHSSVLIGNLHPKPVPLCQPAFVRPREASPSIQRSVASYSRAGTCGSHGSCPSWCPDGVPLPIAPTDVCLSNPRDTIDMVHAVAMAQSHVQVRLRHVAISHQLQLRPLLSSPAVIVDHVRRSIACYGLRPRLQGSYQSPHPLAARGWTAIAVERTRLESRCYVLLLLLCVVPDEQSASQPLQAATVLPIASKGILVQRRCSCSQGHGLPSMSLQMPSVASKFTVRLQDQQQSS